MTKLAYHLANLLKRLGRKGRQLVAIFLVTCERKHLTAQAHELDAVFVIPKYHLGNVPCVSEAKFLDISLASGNFRRLILIGAVFRCMLGLRRILEGMAMLNNTGYAARSGAKYGGVGIA